MNIPFGMGLTQGLMFPLPRLCSKFFTSLSVFYFVHLAGFPRVCNIKISMETLFGSLTPTPQ